MPVLGALLAPEQVPAALSLGTAISSATRIATFFRAINWRLVCHFVPASLPGAWLGVWTLSLMQPMYLDLLLGLFLLGNLPLLLRGTKPADPAEPYGGTASPVSMRLLPAVGLLAGFISGFTGAVGLLFNAFYRRLGLGKEAIIATRAANDILLHLTKIGLYAAYGLLNRHVLLAGAVVALAGVAATLLVRFWLHLVNEHVFRSVGHAAACTAGVAMLVMAGQQVIRQDHVRAMLNTSHSTVSASMGWRAHFYSVAFEHNSELELTHTHPAFNTGTVPGQRGFWYRASAVHVSMTRGVYVTRRLARTFST
jgi:uncharacterized membrane protein YfcA